MPAGGSGWRCGMAVGALCAQRAGKELQEQPDQRRKKAGAIPTPTGSSGKGGSIPLGSLQELRSPVPWQLPAHIGL